MKYTISALFLLSCIVAQEVVAAPAPEYLVINYRDRQCARYWPGDEFSWKTPPPGWQKYLAQGTVTTELGKCQFRAKKEDFAECCKKLQLKFLEQLESKPTQAK